MISNSDSTQIRSIRFTGDNQEFVRGSPTFHLGKIRPHGAICLVEMHIEVEPPSKLAGHDQCFGNGPCEIQSQDQDERRKREDLWRVEDGQGRAIAKAGESWPCGTTDSACPEAMRLGHRDSLLWSSLTTR